VEIAFDRAADKPDWVFAKLTATPHARSVDDLLFHVTVPGFQLQMMSASGKLATSSNPVTQGFYIFNPNRVIYYQGFVAFEFLISNKNIFLP